jgi:hypothetical protein
MCGFRSVAGNIWRHNQLLVNENLSPVNAVTALICVQTMHDNVPNRRE